MSEFSEKSLNVFVVDRRDVPIPGAQVSASYEATRIGGGTTRGLGWAPVILHFGSGYDHLDLEANYGRYSQIKSVSADARNCRFKFDEVTMPRTDIAIIVVGTFLFAAICYGLWFGLEHFAGNQGASWVFGGILLLFIMAVLWFKPNELFGGPQQQLVRILGSIAVALLAGFFTGSLQLGGRVPFANDIQIAAVGGFAAFVFTFMAWPKPKN
jgi:hypothetical protein